MEGAGHALESDDRAALREGPGGRGVWLKPDPHALLETPCVYPYAPVMDEVTDATFEEEVLQSPVPVIVDFWAPWCRPCDAIEPHLRAIAAAHDGRVRLVRLDVDEQLGVPGRYGVLALPTVILFAEGEPQATVYGAQSRERYQQAFERFITG